MAIETRGDGERFGSEFVVWVEVEEVGPSGDHVEEWSTSLEGGRVATFGSLAAALAFGNALQDRGADLASFWPTVPDTCSPCDGSGSVGLSGAPCESCGGFGFDFETGDAVQAAAMIGADYAAHNPDPARAVATVLKVLAAAGLDGDEFRISIERPTAAGRVATVTIAESEPVEGRRWSASRHVAAALYCDAHGVRLDELGRCVTGADAPPGWHRPDVLDVRELCQWCATPRHPDDPAGCSRCGNAWPIEEDAVTRSTRPPRG